MDSRLREEEIRKVAMRIAELGGRQRARVFHLSWWSDRLLARSIVDPAFRTRLFRFVDAFPALGDDAEVEEHLRSEFEGVEAPRWFGTGLGLTKSVPGGSRLSAGVARRSIDRMARQFVMGTVPEEVAREAGELWSRRTATTVDVLGEHTHSEVEADRYAKRLAELVEALGTAASTWPSQELLERDDRGPVPRASVSVKVTALSSTFDALSGDDGIERAAHRLLPVLRRACELSVSVWFDMERVDEKDLTLRLFRRVMSVPGLEELHAGVVVQAYLRDALGDLEELLGWARGRPLAPSVRLVKGAYWDSEVVLASSCGWPTPVFEHKAETDANYERLARTLLEHHGAVRAAFATHNLRSLAAAIVDARELGIPDHGFEVQLLYGMAEPVHEAIRRMGLRLRVYAPMGELVPGMAYLVRRLLENTSNESFVRHHFAEGEELDELLSPPRPTTLPGPPEPAPRSVTDVVSPGPHRREPPAQWHRREVRASFTEAVEAEFSRPARRVAAVIGGEKVRTASELVSVDPADPQTVVARSASCGAKEVGEAVACALAASERWREVGAAARSSVLFRAAQVMRDRRFELAALEVRETGKCWDDADADVCEAIDYLEYYGRRMLVLAAGGEVESPPGETNRLTYSARGVCAVVSPWNFPLAIPAGMTAAALVTGNAVVLKPAEQAPAVASELVEVFSAAGLAPGVLSFVPGSGTEAGAALVGDPAVDVVAFTGSREVGLAILEAASRPRPGRRSIPRVVAELGGKNAIVVDSDADLDEVVPAVVRSAYGFAGQKCSAASRLIVLERVHDAVVERVVEAARSLVIGPPRDPSSRLGPVIDEEARSRLLDALARAPQVGKVALARADVPGDGFYVGPAVVTDVDPESWLAEQELFGPVLATFRAADFEEALELAGRSDYALTAGVFSRSAEHVERATRALRAGNIYVNRAVTGAVVGRQPFGGYGMSGTGSKAGGPDYLLEFVHQRVVTENTVRQGFTQEVLSGPPPLPESMRSEPGAAVGGDTGLAGADASGTEPRGPGDPGTRGVA